MFFFLKNDIFTMAHILSWVVLYDGEIIDKVYEIEFDDLIKDKEKICAWLTTYCVPTIYCNRDAYGYTDNDIYHSILAQNYFVLNRHEKYYTYACVVDYGNLHVYAKGFGPELLIWKEDKYTGICLNEQIQNQNPVLLALGICNVEDDKTPIENLYKLYFENDKFTKCQIEASSTALIDL